MCVSYLSIFICLFSGNLAGSVFSPCNVTDMTCIEKTVNNGLPKIFDGIPELGIESSDPQFNDIIEVNLPMLRVSLINSTLIGYKKCIISKLKFNEDITLIRFDAICHTFEVSGKYEMKGSLIAIPIEGNGDFTFVTGKYFVSIDTAVEKFKGNDGKTHLVIKDFKVDANPLDPIKFKFQNLFNGQEDLAEAVHKFALENWLEVAKLVQYPIWYKSLNTIAKNVNKYLETVDLDETLIK